MNLPDQNNWNPYTVEKIGKIFKGLEWILAGGFALELFVGKNYRKHADIDILIRREDQKLLTNYIDATRIFVAEDGELSPFKESEFYCFPIQDIWILKKDLSAWCLQIMLYDVEEGFWVYKRNKDIKLPQSLLFWEKNDIKIIKPEIQLLYKSFSMRLKDKKDFTKVEPKLETNARKWLNFALKQCY